MLDFSDYCLPFRLGGHTDIGYQSHYEFTRHGLGTLRYFMIKFIQSSWTNHRRHIVVFWLLSRSYCPLYLYTPSYE
jgi:hypothetical protein